MHTAIASTCANESVRLVVKSEFLKSLNPVQMDASSRGLCTHGTRQHILTSIIGWLTTPSEGQNILWLHGLAGSGKSTISTTVAEYIREISCLGAFIFFDRNDPTHSDPNAVIRTLAYRLSLFHPAIKAAVCSQIEGDQTIAEAPIGRQFSKLLLKPLKSIGALSLPGPVVIIVDALDECGDSRSRQDLLALLAQELAKLPPMFRILITSRAELDIKAALHQPNVVARELGIATESNADDISVFLHNEMGIIRDHYKILNLPSDWPGEATLFYLGRRSMGLFIWASTAVRFIMDGYHPKEQLSIILSSGSYEKADAALDALYATALEAAGRWDSKEFSADFRSVVGTVLAGRIPLSEAMIDQLLGLGGGNSTKMILARLGCLLSSTSGQPVRTLHASFADYLTDPARSGNKPWMIDLSLVNDALVRGCLRLMKAGLRFNICGLETSYLRNEHVNNLSQRVEMVIPAQLSYACRFFGDHVQTAPQSEVLCSEITDFMRSRFLYWLEVLSLIGHVSLATPALLKAIRWIKVGRVIRKFLMTEN